MGISIFLARKLSIASSGGKTSPAVRVAVTAVALSTLVMLCAIAVVTGFKHEITEKVSGFNSHMTVSVDVSASPDSGDNLVTLTPSLQKLFDEAPYISDYALQASAPAILKTPSDFKGVYLKSLTGLDLKNFISTSLVSGNIPEYSGKDVSDSIVISSKAADQLGLKPGSKLEMYFITDQIRARQVTVAGVFNSHFDAYDDAYAYASLPFIQDIGGVSPSKGTSIAISTQNLSDVEENAYDLRHRFNDALASGLVFKPYTVTTARDSGASYFQWLSLLDMNVVVVLALMSVVACVTIVSGMLILMVDKIRFIALMRALGASRQVISRVFILLASKITLHGVVIGNILALLLIYVQQRTHFIPLDAESYYIDFVPMSISWQSVMILDAGVITLIWLVLLIPSRFAGKVAPGRTLASE
ncbi:MAG: ABC transporter permease [Bacteroides sp.]|nr:ABC transporter permease [Bacteroides sp.]